MMPSFRTVFAALLVGGALVTAAASPGPAAEHPLSPGDFAGTWITWWDEDGEPSACTRLYVAVEDDSTLDGMWAAPGFNGLVNGAVQQTRGGLRWEGEWRDPEGPAGGFRFVLGVPGAPAHEFRGVFTTEDDAEERMWNGAREVPGEPMPAVPCSFDE